MSDFIHNVDRIIENEIKAFKHATSVTVYEAKRDYLTAILERLRAYKAILFPLAYGDMKNADAKKRYDVIAELYMKVSDAKSALLPDVEEDEKNAQEIREATRMKYGIA